MQAASSPPDMLGTIDWAVRAHTLEGQDECGDGYLVTSCPHGVLAAVVDGLGHGSEAATATRVAVEVLKQHVGSQAAELMKYCHEALHKTRGAVVSLAIFNTLNETMTWVGVGNVEGMLFRADGEKHPARESLLSRSGVCGYQIPPLRVVTLSIFAGDTLVFVTDGIDSAFGQDLPLGQAPDGIADHILSRHLKKTDDALVLVIRYLGAKA